jgi:FtsP/CotA-like multicopper oxidase with cupredoxin domain
VREAAKNLREDVMRALRRSSRNIGVTAAAVVAAFISLNPVSAANFTEPAVFASTNGLLDIMMVARPKPIATLTFQPPGRGAAIHPTGWVYEVCKLPPSGLACPSGSGTVADYGGVRLALQPGDTLKVRFVNRLPKVDPNKLNHITDPGQANLFRNPTNIHTHGLLTPGRAATLSDPTFGDFVFVTVYNSANGIPVPQTTHQHGPIVMDTIDYKIPVPNNHPSGLLWFHPHVHGIALNQVVQGLSGLLTVGSVGDNVRGDAANVRFPDANVRHMLLKEIQVLATGTVDFDSGPQPVANGEVLNQEDPGFCAPNPAANEVRQGSCPGQDNRPDGSNFIGGKWYFTVSGQQFPTIPITAPDGEIWRIATAAGSLSYDLQLVNDATHQPMVVQLIAIDGVSVHLPQDTPMGSMVRMGAGKFRVVPCPAAQVIGSSVPVCVNEVVMMPSARVEMWVTYRDQNGRIVTAPRGASATLKNLALTMGSGDTWPAVDLAKVQFNQTTQRQFTSNQVVVNDSGTLQPGGILVTAVPAATASPLPPGCAALPAGHRRRIFFGFANVFAEGETFALGYEEVDQDGNPVPGTQKPGPNQLEQFDPSRNTVCLPLGPGQKPVTERWEMVQLATENHNFHMHQSRFVERTGTAASVIQDNFALGVAVPDATIADQVANNQLGVCTVQQWRSGHCVSPPVVMDIPFSQLGEFVYHCHILEHEDGGMMAKIQVVASPR